MRGPQAQADQRDSQGNDEQAEGAQPAPRKIP